MKELEDFDWFPSILRNFQTEFIGFVVAKFYFYKPFVSYLNSLMLVQKPLTDLCSGSGEPALCIFSHSNCFSSLLLTDKFPNTAGSNHENIAYDHNSKDVLQMKFTPDRYYTMLNSFHHFTDEEKLQLVNKIQSGGTTAFFVEVLEPTVWCGIKVTFMTIFGTLLLTPFVRPFSFKRLLFTYIFPINLLTIFFDGILSVLKSRSVKQYQRLFTHHGQTLKIERLKNILSTNIVIHIHPTI